MTDAERVLITIRSSVAKRLELEAEWMSALGRPITAAELLEQIVTDALERGARSR